MSGVTRRPSVVVVEAAMETRVVPEAFRRAETVRGVGLGLTRVLSVVSAAFLAVLALAVYIAGGLVGKGIGPFVPDLVAMVALAAYAAVAPAWFARLSRATTAAATARRLLVVLAGYTAGWAVLVQVV
jgi:hypothetical protein